MKENKNSNLTPEELDSWAAEKLMGWTTLSFSDYYLENWHPTSPDAPAWQVLAVIEKMQELNFFVQIEDEGLKSGEFCVSYGITSGIYSKNLLIAILQAAYVAWLSTQEDKDNLWEIINTNKGPIPEPNIESQYTKSSIQRLKRRF